MSVCVGGGGLIKFPADHWTQTIEQLDNRPEAGNAPMTLIPGRDDTSVM